MAQHIERAALLQLAHQFLHQHIIRVARVSLGELIPAIRPGVLEVTQHIFGIQRCPAVVAAGRAHKPALGGQRADNVLLELIFLAIRHYAFYSLLGSMPVIFYGLFQQHKMFNQPHH
ncbi:hypothetical protein BW687_009445 [Pseudomonas graminis]|uniref:hypothetical protein n=1 Tax=Pseudomonas graminis TaxID=158627 RepID=UPI002349BEB6|nr:hypothetical protein [Pseudomonas graminis]MDC6380400.1 hypothetical protein [Pseudomonas graminis]